MFRCDSCHTEYGGIRGLAAGTCPRCRSGTTTPPRSPVVLPDTSSLDDASFRVSRLPASAWSAPTLPLVGEIAQLDRAARL